MSSNLKLIVGLGNPGEQYARTRHNAGVWFVSRFADQQGATFKEEKKFFGRTATTLFESQEMRLLLPTTYMNESGKSVRALAHFFKIPPEQILIVHDELDLEPGRFKVKLGGGLAGHNGLKSIRDHLKTVEFVRLRIGVGKAPDRMRGADWVLKRPGKADRQLLDEIVATAADSVEMLLAEPAVAVMNRFNK